MSTLGLASAIAVVAAVLAAISLLPAFLGLLGHRIAWLSLPAFMRPKQAPAAACGRRGPASYAGTRSWSRSSRCCCWRR